MRGGTWRKTLHGHSRVGVLFCGSMGDCTDMFSVGWPEKRVPVCSIPVCRHCSGVGVMLICKDAGKFLAVRLKKLRRQRNRGNGKSEKVRSEK